MGVASEPKLTVLHLCGSAVSEYYEGVSSYYASNCVDALVKQGTFKHRVAKVSPDGSWSFPIDLSPEAVEKADSVSLADAIRIITDEIKPDVLNPIMFCIPGVTSYRALFEDLLGVPLIGCNSSVMALSENKAMTKAVCAAAGVPTPESQLLHAGDRPKMSPPYILKPCREGNSQGITLIRETSTEEEIDAGLKKAFALDCEVLCERFVALGREIRVAVVEQEDGSLKMLPVLEYFLTPEHPCRTPDDKLMSDTRGMPTVPVVTDGDRKCPADVDPVLREKLRDMAVRAHKALGCRDYSLYDVRVDPAGEPFMLEACLYCSFAPMSIIVGMSKHTGVGLKEIFEAMVKRALGRKRVPAVKGEGANGGQLFGMNMSR